MHDLLLWAFWLAAAAVFVGLPLAAYRRSRRFGIFALAPAIAVAGAVIIHWRVRSLVSPGLAPWLDGLFAYSLACGGFSLLRMRKPRMRGALLRLGVSLPGQVFLAGSILSAGWLLLMLPLRALLWLLDAQSALELLRWADWTPLAVAIASLFTSTRPVSEVVRIRLGAEGPDEVARIPVERHRRRTPALLDSPALRVVQITDPHLGPWQSVAKLRRHVESLVARDPHLILLTGDFLTRETNASASALEDAFSPLRAAPGRCFAVFGNHDHEAPEVVRSALAGNGVHLLVDAAVCVKTPVTSVQIIGSDYVRGAGRAEHLKELLGRHPRIEDHLRILLLHDPSGFRDVPNGEADVTFSGHTHGGQVGLVSLGLDWTVLTRTRFPDHGLFGRGPNRLYVHRGTGFYGFPLRVGVPGESSLLELILE